MASNSFVGKLILFVSVSLFLYYFFWVSILPFMRIENDNWIHSFFPPLEYGFIGPVTFGALLVSSVIAFTMYHTGDIINFF